MKMGETLQVGLSVPSPTTHKQHTSGFPLQIEDS